jgi:hypothetical protein
VSVCACVHERALRERMSARTSAYNESGDEWSVQKAATRGVCVCECECGCECGVSAGVLIIMRASDSVVMALNGTLRSSGGNPAYSKRRIGLNSSFVPVTDRPVGGKVGRVSECNGQARVGCQRVVWSEHG